MATKQTKPPKDVEIYAPQPFVEAFANLTNSPEQEEKQANLPVVKPKMGRPTKYSQQLADVICTRIAEGESLREIVKTEGMPERVTIYRWLMDKQDFCNQYVRAREEQADTLADEILAICDENPEFDYVKDKQGNVVDIKIDSGYVAYQRQRIDARKWVASKLKPKKYSENLKLSGDAENPVEIGVTMLDAFVKKLELKAQVKNAE